MGLLVSILGMAALIGIAVLLSVRRQAIRLRTVGIAFAIQFGLGAFVLYVPWGRNVLAVVTGGFANVIECGNEGIRFLFGGLIEDTMFELLGESGGFIFAFRVLPMLIFLGWAGSGVGVANLSLELIFGYLFAPLAFIIGVPWNEAVLAGSFIGQKVVANEFLAYLNFAPYLGEHAMVVAQTGQVMSAKTEAIISFALCGFANFSSIAVLLGGLGCLVPERRRDIARMGVKAVVAGTLSNLMAGTIAGFCVSLGAL